MPSIAYKNDYTPNAFAIGGLMSNGLVCVNSGLIDKIKSLDHFPEKLKKEIKVKLKIDREPEKDEVRAHLLKAVLAHELGHIYYNHGLKKSFIQAGLRVLLRFVDLVPLLKLKFLAKIFKNLLSSVPIGFYSRGCETQADSFAVKHGYGVGLEVALGEVFHNKNSPLDFHSNDFAEPLIHSYKQLSSSHPSKDDRINDIRKNISKA